MKMNLEIYLFCGEYHHNHEVLKKPNILDYRNRYSELLGLTMLYESKWYKRLYTQNKERYFEQLEYNIKQCQLKMEMDAEQQLKLFKKITKKNDNNTIK
jgi:5,10-methylene-tetrahydrofolate dehydrogenase/methenyl tetrahydrofolate cyclohydrolase